MKQIEKKVEEFNKKFKHTSWYPDNWEPIEKWIVKALQDTREEVLQEVLNQSHEKLNDIDRYWKHDQHEILIKFINKLKKK